MVVLRLPSVSRLLVFIGATVDSKFRAFDSRTGKELWVTTPAPAGKIGEGLGTGRLHVYALP